MKNTIPAVKAPVIEKRGITRKEQVAEFLNGKPFLNSRVAFRDFKIANPTLAIKQTYFYTLFKSFGTRVKRGDRALTTIAAGTLDGNHKNCMTAYQVYLKEDFGTDKPLRFTHFLKMWKKHFNVTGYVRRKPKVAKQIKLVKVIKVEAEEIKPEIKTVQLSTLSAKQIIAKANELLKSKAKSIPTNLKNKAGIVKTATQLFVKAGYQIA